MGPVILASVLGDGLFSLRIPGLHTDDRGLVVADDVTVTVLYDPVSMIASLDASICRNETAVLRAFPSLNFGAQTAMASTKFSVLQG